MGDILSKQCGDEPADVAPPAPEQAPLTVPPAAAVPARTRRRVKVTPSRVKTAASLSCSSADDAAAEAPQKPSSVGTVQAQLQHGNAAAQAGSVAAPPHAPPAAIAGVKRKAPEPGSSTAPSAQSKRQQLLGLTILTMGTLLGMAPFAPQRTLPDHGGGPSAAEPAGQHACAPPPAGPEPQTAETPQASDGRPEAAADAQAAGRECLVSPARNTRSAVIAEPAAVGPADEQPEQLQRMDYQQQESQQQQVGIVLELEPMGTPVPARCQPADEPDEATPAAAAQPPPMQPPLRSPVALPASAGKPLAGVVNRSQLRQKLLHSKRSPAAATDATASPSQPAAAYTPPNALARSTRGQRLLSLARGRQHGQRQASMASVGGQQGQAAATPAVPAPAADSGGHMQLDSVGPDAGAAVVHAADAAPATAEPRMATYEAPLAQRRLTQSPLSRPANLGAGGAGAWREGVAGCGTAGDEPTPQPSPAAAASPPGTTGGGAGASTPQPQRSTPPTPATAEPSSTPRPAVGAAPGVRDTSPASPSAAPLDPHAHSDAPSPAVNDGAVQAALRQIDALLLDLRGDSPQPSNPPAAHVPPAVAADRQGELEVQSALQQAGSPPPPQAGHGAAPPCSPPEVCSRPHEAGADNFPGFWRPPAPERHSSAAAPAPDASRAGRGRKRPAPCCSGDGADGGEAGQQPGSTQGQRRRVRFSLPEPAEPEAPVAAATADAAVASAAPVPAQQQQQQQREQQQQASSGPTTIVLAPPVLPSGSRPESRQGTPARPAHLPMPQPPAYSRFGAAAFRRPYSGPQGRRQTLLSFVSDAGATCVAVPPGMVAAAGGDAGADGPCEVAQTGGAGAPADAGGVVIPRRLQHREGLRRRSLQPAPPSPQGPSLLEQEVREAFINARLAEHAGERWARLDMAGCELAPGGGHADALAQLSGKLEELQGPEAVQQLMGQLDAEWQHLKRLRQYATQGAAPAPAAAAAASAPAPGDAAARAEEASGAGRPRGILKHRSRLGGAGGGAGTQGLATEVGLTVGDVRKEAAGAATAAGVQQPTAEQPNDGEQPGAGVLASFEAVLAADIVQDLPLADVPSPGVAASVAEHDGVSVPEAAEHGGAAAMEVDAQPASPAAPAQPQAAPAAATPAAQCAAAPAQASAQASEEPQALPAPEQGGERSVPGVEAPDAVASTPVAADAAFDPELSQEPRPVELSPGPQLSRGAKMLQRCTPTAAGKVQALLQSAAEQGRRAGHRGGLSPFAAPVRLLKLGDVGRSSAAPPRRGMSRGERLLASLRQASGGGGLHGSGTGAAAAHGAGGTVQPTSGQHVGLVGSAAAGEQDEGEQRGGIADMAEDGPTVAPAAAVVLGA